MVNDAVVPPIPAFETDEAAFAAFQGGDVRGFNHLYSAYFERLVQFLEARGIVHADAQDVVQDLFTSLWNRRASIDLRSAVKSYLFRFAMNLAIDTRRAGQRTSPYTEVNGTPAGAVKLANTGEELLAREDIAGLYQEVVSRLTEQQVVVLALRLEQGLSNEEAGEVMQLSPFTVRNHFNTARRALTETFQEAGYLNERGEVIHKPSQREIATANTSRTHPDKASTAIPPPSTEQKEVGRVERSLRRALDALLRQPVALASLFGVVGFGVMDQFDYAAAVRPLQRPKMEASKETGVGQRDPIYLSDGTAVTLGPKSLLLYDDPVERRGSRRVYLEGAAHFTVAPQAKPFVVEVRGVEIRALGTEFDVRAHYSMRERLSLYVTHGRVAISLARDGVRETMVVSAGDLATVTPGGSVEIRRSAQAGVMVWHEGRLELRGIPLGAVVRELPYWYSDVEYVVSNRTNDLRDVPVTGVIPTTSALQAAELVARGAGVNCVIDSERKKVEFFPRPRGHGQPAGCR